jgi:hypothetical protein
MKRADGHPVAAPLDIARVRKDFPMLGRTTRGRPLVYLDNANSTQKPQTVIDAEADFYAAHYSNIHRGVYLLSQEATAAYDRARARVAQFLNAKSPKEIVFVRGTTEAINLVAGSWGRANLKSGDEVLISGMEHHSGIVPWQLACEASGAHLRVIPVSDDGELILEEAEKLFTPRTKILSVIHISNALGTVNPVRELIAMARARGVAVLKAAAEKAKWQTRPSHSQPTSGDIAYGRGVAMLGSDTDTNVAGIYEVAVNRKTGMVKVERVTIAHDCGLIVNPGAVRNQIEGGVIQSISRALKEEVTFDRSRVTSLDWASYPIITFNEIPDEIDIVLLDHPDSPPTRVGEPAGESTWPGVANAIYDAIGVRLRQLPMTPQRVLAGLAGGA